MIKTIKLNLPRCYFKTTGSNIHFDSKINIEESFDARYDNDFYQAAAELIFNIHYNNISK